MPSVTRAKAYLAQQRPSTALPGLVVISGGTTGIGSAIAVLIARQGCQRAIIVGRNEEAAGDVLARMRVENTEGQYAFVKGDLATKRGMKAVCDEVIDCAGSSLIDVLIMTQNGVPTGNLSMTEDGHDRAFAVQSLSRFFLPHYFASQSFLSPSAKIICLANAGVSLDDLDINDLSLIRREGKYGRTRLFFQQSFRDSSVLDSFIVEMNERDPARAVYHIHPGLVKTATFDTSSSPLLIRIMMTMGLWTIATSPEHIAHLPVYLALADDTERSAEIGDSRLFDHTLKAISPGKWAASTENRKKLWEKLVEILAL